MSNIYSPANFSDGIAPYGSPALNDGQVQIDNYTFDTKMDNFGTGLGPLFTRFDRDAALNYISNYADTTRPNRGHLNRFNRKEYYRSKEPVIRPEMPQLSGPHLDYLEYEQSRKVNAQRADQALDISTAGHPSQYDQIMEPRQTESEAFRFYANSNSKAVFQKYNDSTRVPRIEGRNPDLDFPPTEGYQGISNVPTISNSKRRSGEVYLLTPNLSESYREDLGGATHPISQRKVNNGKEYQNNSNFRNTNAIESVPMYYGGSLTNFRRRRGLEDIIARVPSLDPAYGFDSSSLFEKNIRNTSKRDEVSGPSIPVVGSVDVNQQERMHFSGDSYTVQRNISTINNRQPIPELPDTWTYSNKHPNVSVSERPRRKVPFLYARVEGGFELSKNDPSFNTLNARRDLDTNSAVYLQTSH